MFVGGIVVEDDVDGLLRRNRFFDAVEEADELLMAMALHTPADHLTFECVEGSKQRGGTVTLVVMSHGSGAGLLYRQAWLGTVQRLDLAFLIDGQNHGMGRWVDIKSLEKVEPATAIKSSAGRRAAVRAWQPIP
jgi:hypothetical protein